MNTQPGERNYGAAIAQDGDWLQSLRVFGYIGCVNFGGPAAQIALMHRVFVEQRGWLSDEEFMHALNVCMLLPGPEALQLAIYAGWRRHGIAGGLLSGLLFILPGFLVVVTLAGLYAQYRELGPMAGLFLGIQAATLGIVIEALLKVAKRALKSRLHVSIAFVAFAALYSGLLAYPVIVILAGAAGYFFAARPQAAPAPQERNAPAVLRRAAALTLACIGLWLGFYLLLILTTGPQSVFVQLAEYFSLLAPVAFGGAYAMLAAVTADAVTRFHWLTAEAMVTGLGLAETTPGPLVLVLSFVGFQAAAGGGLASGLLGASVSAFAMFLPSFYFIFLAAPHLGSLHHRTGPAAALSGITAAVVGVIGHLSLWFGLHFLFSRTQLWQPVDLLRLPVPEPASLDPAALILSATCALVLFRTRFGLIGSLGTGAVLGILTRTLWT